MVVSCLNQDIAVVMIVHMKVAKPSDGSTTTTMLAVGGLEKSVTTKLLTQDRPYAQLLMRIPRRRVIQPSFLCSFLVQYNVPPTYVCCSI